MPRLRILGAVVAAMIAGSAAAQAQNAPKPEPAPALTPAPVGTVYPEPGPPQDPGALGRGVQRTMTLLATSTPQHRNHVRILFYGQSITEQDWTKQVAADLRRRFPYADLEIENRAIGGFASQLLVRPAEHDLYPFYPDLLIFHVYGADNTYEEIIKNVRSRTAAEVLMQKDHATAWPPEHIDRTQDRGKWWDDYMNSVFLPATAKKYDCGLADIRSGWLDYLKANHQEPRQLTIDGTHLNDQGNFLMARLIERYLVYLPELPKTDWQNLSQTFAVGKEEVSFNGNRVDLLPFSNPSAGAVHILIDGKPPSSFPEAYCLTRPQPNPWASPLALARVDHEAPLIPEDWTLTITSVGPDSKTWTYTVTGSVTGPDGSGSSESVFTSHSGRVRIDPAAFFRGFGKDPVPVGHTITWHARLMGQDTCTIPASNDKPITVVQGIPNGHHTLTLICDAPEKEKSAPSYIVRTYCPPFAP